MIRLKEDFKATIRIDLDGPMGNVFYILGLVKPLSKELGLDDTALFNEMTGYDYFDLIKAFDKYFGDHVIFETTDPELFARLK